MDKKRKYSDEYIQYGLTALTVNDVDKPQCVLCCVVLSVEAMKPSKLKRHLDTKHSEHSTKDVAGLKRQIFDATGSIQQQNTAVVQASYDAALEIVKNKKPHRRNSHQTQHAENGEFGS
ncbi:SCAN domain-containing protein 3-like [Ochlerotatus camptorhynchus]|uniref:SCAN domain-containing protein 3-like n=1 Tax=Ochlerotatus camptorhynchus TaxID=644619 RepID=UPI0031DECA72